MAVNNAATLYRPDLWLSVDDPGNFPASIWQDPGIVKFGLNEQLDRRIRLRTEDGKLIRSKLTAREMPATFGFLGNYSFDPETWLTEETINLGHQLNETDVLGLTGSISVMYPAIRLLYHFGCSRVFLLGCDFQMNAGERPYAFDQSASKEHINLSNQNYWVIDERFKHLNSVFEEKGFKVYNCTPRSGLTAFESLSYEDAIASVAATCHDADTFGLYDDHQRHEAHQLNKSRARLHLHGKGSTELSSPSNTDQRKATKR